MEVVSWCMCVVCFVDAPGGIDGHSEVQIVGVVLEDVQDADLGAGYS
jgi:hypothetical protein